MKSFTITQIASALVVASLLAACSAATPDKQTQLAELKAEQVKLADKIRKLESELPKDSTVDTSVAKEVVTVALAPRKFDHYVQTQGAIESLENIQVSAKSPGIITDVFAIEGEQVHKGQILGQIDNSLLVRSVEEIKSSLELATTVYERQKNLWEQKIGSEVQYLQAKNNKEGLERKLASLNEQIDMTRIKSPINGIVDEVTMRVGQNISPGMPAARVINNANLKVKANVSEAYTSLIKKGNRAKVIVGDINREFDATVTFVGRNINQLSRTFVVEVKLPSDADLRANMTAVLKVIFETSDNALTVPVNVIQDVNGQKIVYVVETVNNRTVATHKAVEVTGVYDAVAHIKSGLKAGDQVITVGYQGLNDGELVKQ